MTLTGISEPKRIDGIDIFRGLAILLVVIGHTNSPINGLIYMFHMPAFFIISGYTAALKNVPFRKYVLDKIGTILVPFYGSNIFFLVLLMLLTVFDIYRYFFTLPFSFAASMKSLIQDFGTADLGGATWFLIVLFWASLVAKIINIFCEKMQLPVLLAWLLSCLMYGYGHHLVRHHTAWPALMDLTFYAVFYFMTGYLLGKKPIRIPELGQWILTGISGALMIYYLQHWALVQMNWPARIFGHPIHNILGSFSGSYILFRITRFFQYIRPLDRILVSIGKRSLTILTMHFLAFRICFCLLYLAGLGPIEQLRWQVPKTAGYLWVWITGVSLVLCLGIDWTVRKIPGLRTILLGAKLSNVRIFPGLKWSDGLGRDNRYLYADILRIVSIVAVVLLHTPLVIICNYEKMPFSWWKVANVYQSAVRFAVPDFIMLSGALLLMDERHASISFVLRKRITRVLFPLLFFSVIYMVYKRPGMFLEDGFLWDMVKSILTGPVYYHLWFLYLLIGLYLLIPILYRFVRSADQSLLLYGLGLWVICATINPLLETLIRYKMPIAPIELTGYVGYFLLGYVLHHLKITLNWKLLAQLGTVVLCAITITAIGTEAYSSRDHRLNETFYGYLTLNVFIAATAIFFVIRNGCYSFIEKRNWLKKGIQLMSNASFGVYLIHILVLETLSNQFQIHSSMFHPLMAIPMTAVLACVISFIISIGMNQLPFHRFLV